MKHPVKITRHITRDTCDVPGGGCPASQRNPDKPCWHRTRYSAECRLCSWTAESDIRSALVEGSVWGHEALHAKASTA